MGRHAHARCADRDRALALADADRPLDTEERAALKQAFTGIGGLVASEWNRGQYFTPSTVVAFLHDLLDLRDRHGTVLDLGCGGGGMFEGLDAAQCTGIEVDTCAAKVAHLCYPAARIIHDDVEAVFPSGHPSPFDAAFDHVIGNPPFGLRSRCVLPPYGPAPREVRSEELFLYLAYRACRPGGDMALILPDGMLGNSSSGPLRRWFGDRCCIRAVVSLPIETFVHTGTQVKTSLLYLQRFSPGPRPAADYQIFMAIAETIGWDTRRRETGTTDLPEILTAWRTFRDHWLDPSVAPADPPLAPHSLPRLPPPPAVRPTSTPARPSAHAQLSLF